MKAPTPNVLARLGDAAGTLGLKTVDRYRNHLDAKRLTRLTKECPALFVVGGEWTVGDDSQHAVYLLVVTEADALDGSAEAQADDISVAVAEWFYRQDWGPLRIHGETGIRGGTAHAGDRFAVSRMAVPFVAA